MELLNTIVNEINNILWSYVLIIVLVGSGIYFTLSTRFVQLRLLPEMIRLLTDGVGTKTEGHAGSHRHRYRWSRCCLLDVGYSFYRLRYGFCGKHPGTDL